MRFLAHNGTERGAINGHIARQYVIGEEIYVDRVLKLERFMDEIQRIESEYGLTRSPPDFTSCRHNPRFRLERRLRRIADAADVEITARQVRQGRFPAYESFYDSETVRLVRECFAADFDAYGYDT